MPIRTCLGVLLVALPPLMASASGASGGLTAPPATTRAVATTPASGTARPVIPPEIARIRREARQQAVDLRRGLLTFSHQVRGREAADSWNEWLRFKLADSLGRLWSAERDLERALAEAPLDVESQSAAVRRWQPTLARLRDLDHRLRQRDAESRGGQPGTARLVVLPPGTSSLSGRVADALTGLGVDGSVELYDATGRWVDMAPTDPAGGYAFAPLPPGDYHVKTSTYGSVHLDELYDDILCPASCDVTSGTVVSLTAGVPRAGVDFLLDRGGLVSGRVTATDSGLGVETQVYIVDASGAYTGWAYSDSSGRYSSSAQLPGSRYVVAGGNGLHLWQLYQGLPCPRGTCDATTGTPVAVVRNGVAAGIDFSLLRGGQIGGQVVDQVSGVALAAVEVAVFDPGGVWVAGAETNASGEYRSGIGLETGTYFAVATPPRPHLPELYQGRPCFDGSCDPTSGTAIAVAAGATTSGVDFGLPRGGSIAGRVTDATSAVGVEAGIRVFDAQGSSAVWSNTDAAGVYEVAGLPPGSYFVQANPPSPYLPTLFDDVPCFDGSCDPTGGTPVAVALGTPTAGINMAVPRGGSVSGTVVDETSGGPIAGAWIEVRDADGRWRGQASTNVLGSYAVSGLVPGSAFVSVTNTGPYWPELYDGVPCPRYGCGDIPGGSPVPVSLGGSATGVDFRLGTVSSAASGFFTIDACRAVDTRGPDGPALAAGTERVFDITSSVGDCIGIYGARAVSLNVTVVGADAPGNVRLYAAGGPMPATSTVSYPAGVTRANNAVIALNAEGRLAVYVGQAFGNVHLVVDVNGYFE